MRPAELLRNVLNQLCSQRLDPLRSCSLRVLKRGAKEVHVPLSLLVPRKQKVDLLLDGSPRLYGLRDGHPISELDRVGRADLNCPRTRPPKKPQDQVNERAIPLSEPRAESLGLRKHVRRPDEDYAGELASRSENEQGYLHGRKSLDAEDALHHGRLLLALGATQCP